MSERYSNRARSVIFLAVGSARRRGAAYIESEELLQALVLEDRRDLAAGTAELFAGSPAPMKWLGSDHRPFFSNDINRETAENVEEPPRRRSATCRFRAL
jgi:hypothetical protein